MRSALPETAWFRSTWQAANADLLSKWKLIEAIAKDALANDLPISGEESCSAAFKALEAANHEHTSQTVRNLCVVAKFDAESNDEQRMVWRRYGWTVVREVAKAGWTQDAAAELLGGKQLKRREVVARLRVARDPGVPENVDPLAWEKQPIEPGEWAEWVKEMSRVLTHGARLAVRTENTEGLVLGAHDAIAFVLYQRLNERAIDAEIRQLLESESTE
jgi:hypothetical protein